MKTYKIFVGGFQIGTEELTAEEVKKMNNSGIVVVPVEKYFRNALRSVRRGIASRR